MENEGMDLDIIINPKTTDDGQAVIQVRAYVVATISSLIKMLLAGDGCRCSH